MYEVGDVVVSCPLQLQENVEMRGDVVREISCDTGGADSLPVRPCEGLCARQEGRPNNSPPTVKSENKTTRRRYQEKKVKECRNNVVKRACVNVEVRAVCVVGVRRTVVGRNLNLVKIEGVCIIKKVKKNTTKSKIRY